MKRFPLWLTLIPLVIAGGVYWQVWSGYRDTLRADIGHFVPGANLAIGGFPYRMEATVAAPAIGHRGGVVSTARAADAVVNRAPWQRDLTIVRTLRPAIEASVPALAGVSAAVTAATGVASIHLDAGRIARLSNVFGVARLTTGLFAAPITAATFEVHLRELTPRSNEAWSPAPPLQAEISLAGTSVSFGNGVPLTLAANLGVTAVGRLRSYAGWTDGGTLEIRALTLADASGEVLRLVATAVPAGGRLRFAGTIATVCPETVRAAFAGVAPPRESRLRLAVRLAFGGSPGAFELAPLLAGTPRAVRGQIAPCPRLSG